MANPTTNYGFVLPTSTDLVTDLPADFDVALQGVDTRLKALQPGTTSGDLAYSSATANTNVRLGIGTAGQVLAVSGGVPAWTTTADVTPLTTKGDLFTFTTVDARIGVGANDTVLTADSAEATGLKWAAPVSGGMTLISTTALTGASITLSSIAGTYNNLVIILRDFELAASTGGQLQYQLNSDTTANAHRQITQSGQSTTSTTASATGTSFTTVDDTVGYNPTTNYSQITIFDYANAISRKAVSVINAFGGNTGNIYTQNLTGSFTVTTAITSVKIALSAGTFSAGNALLYGVK